MLKHRATQQAARYAFGIEFHQSFRAKESTSTIPSTRTRAYLKTPQAEPNGRMKTLKDVLIKETPDQGLNRKKEFSGPDIKTTY